MTKEQIYLEIYRKAPSSMNFYDYKRIAIEAMEEYGKQQYNQAIEDAADSADADYTCLSGFMKEDVEVYVIKDSILKLKKT